MRRLLLDTHALLWWLDGDQRLPLPWREHFMTPGVEVLVSAVSAWEIATKARIGKLPEAKEVAQDIAGAVRSQGFQELVISFAHAQKAGDLPGPLRDPFDRMLIAQCMIESLSIVSLDHAFDTYGVRRLWQ